MRGEAVVVAPLHDAVVGVGAYDGYLRHVLVERQQRAAVLKQHAALLGHTQREVAVLAAVNDAVRYVAPLAALVHLAKLEAGLQDTLHNYAFQLVVNLADSAFTQIEARLTTQRMREPNEECWKYQLGVINEQSHRYAAAIAHYKTALEQEASDVAANRIAVCCTALADYAAARDYYALAAQLDSTQTSCVYNRGCTEMQLQRYADAERTITQHITTDPSEAAPYVVRAAARHHQGNLRGAADDYTTAIALDTDHAQELLFRGVIYRKLGEEAKAVADFRQILLDDSLAHAALDGDTIAIDTIAISDIIGRQQYMTANGEVSEGTVINLREVSLGTLSLRDVRASVVRNQQAPLLLGQSVLQRLGRIEIDNAKSVLRITTRQKAEGKTPIGLFNVIAPNK